MTTYKCVSCQGVTINVDADCWVDALAKAKKLLSCEEAEAVLA